jgi:hypothetical protein
MPLENLLSINGSSLSSRRSSLDLSKFYKFNFLHDTLQLIIDGLDVDVHEGDYSPAVATKFAIYVQ